MKTAKEKATELYDQINVLVPIDAQLSDTGKQASDKMIKDHKSTLLICHKLVNEITGAGNDIISELIDGYHDLEFNMYWQEVKNELNKI